MAKFLGCLRALFAVLFVRPLRFCRRLPALRRRKAFPLAKLMKRAGVHRSVTPELLEVARLAGLRLDGEEAEEQEEKAEEGQEEQEEEAEEEPAEETVEGLKTQLQRITRESRKHERRSKSNHTKVQELENQLKEKEKEEQTDHEKAVEKAREEARKEALSEAEKERRGDRLESACIRQAAKKVEVRDGDDKKKVRFEDPEDLEVFLQRKIAKGDVDLEDLFDADGKAKADVLEEAAKEILEERPRLAEDSGEEKPKKPEGGGDGGKGKEPAGEPSVEDLVKKKQRG